MLATDLWYACGGGGGGSGRRCREVRNRRTVGVRFRIARADVCALATLGLAVRYVHPNAALR
jgi:hypothetical protein